MRFLVVLSTLGALSGACRTVEDYRAYETESDTIHRVWAEVFQMAGEAPSVEWVGEDRWDCPDGSPRWRTLSTSYCGVEACREGPKMVCVRGLAPSAVYVQVARGDGQGLSETALAHELTHAALMRLGIQDGDQFHRGPEWLPGGIAAEATAALKP